MKIRSTSDTLHVTDLRALSESRAGELAQGIREALTPDIRTIEFDLAQLRAIDCGTVEVLLAVHEEINRAGTAFAWRLLNPPPDIRQLLELVRLHHLFGIFPPRVPGMAFL